MPIYLKLNTVTGESKAKGHVGWIELTSFAFGESRGQEISEASCTKNPDSTSVTLARLALDGKPQPATIDFVDGEGKIYLQLQLESLLITSYSFSGSGGGGHPPTESMTLNFTKFTVVKFSADVPDDAGNLLQDLLSAP